MLGRVFKYLFIFGLLISLITIIFPSNAEINDYTGDYALPKYDKLHIEDTIKGAKLKFPLPKKNINPLQDKDNSPLYGSDPSNITTEIEYDPETNDYIFKRKLGDIELDAPYSLSFDEYKDYNFNKAMKSYWKQRSKGDVSDQRPTLIPKLEVGGEMFDRIFGGNVIDIRPQGYAELSFGLTHSKTQNPALPLRAQSQPMFDFDIKIQMNVIGQIGEKMKVTLKHDTEGFDFENAVKLEYTGYEDEIIQKIEAGNVSLPLPGTLISGSQSLFGFKTEAKFGRLTLTSIFSQQKGESSTIELEGGQQTKDFEIKADQYEANKHFFLSHFFKEQYDEALSILPIVKSGININRIEVWITNKAGAFDDSRNLVSFADLAESNINLIQSDYVRNNATLHYTAVPQDDVNVLSNIDAITGGNVRDINLVTNSLSSLGFQGGIDYEKIESARLLKPNEYTINEQLGYISLNSAIRADQVLAVAYEYTLGGEVYRVGDFSNSAITAPQALIVKMLKGTTSSPQIKTWSLMMKNIYNSGAYQISPEDFICDVFYNNDKTGTEINFLPVGNVDSIRLISVLNLDNLNKQKDPYPDGIYDYIEGLTINSKGGKLIFPVLEPFGSYLKKKITNGDTSLDKIADEYVFQELYDSTQSKAKQIAEKNKFVLKGRYKSTGGSEIPLNAMNIPQGSVKVTSGAVLLTENVDYTVDYNLGRVKIINQGILESGTPIKIDLESNSLMNVQTKTLIGTHANYEFSKNFNVGATILHHSEKPLVKKVSIGDEPVSNTIWGFNTSYRADVPFLTKVVDFIPFIETKEMSTITMTGEFAHLIPGHSSAIEKEGNAYIDDFEGSKTSIDLKSHVAWSISSTPADTDLFPESQLTNDLSYGYNRAKVAWYVIDQFFHQLSSPVDAADRSNHYVRQVYERELFPNKDAPTSMPTNLSALSVVFYPKERGPYNYDAVNIDSDGLLLNPEKRWGGLTRSLQTTDFEDSNIEYIEFWLMDPFVHSPDNAGGDLYFNLGDISEDVLKDGRKSFEHGLPSPKSANPVDTTAWGLVPKMQSLVNVFDADGETRLAQDVGLDGLSDEDERIFFSSKGKHNYLDQIALKFGEQSEAYKKAYNDPSSDNFHHYRGRDYDEETVDILGRYKDYNGLEGNSKPTEFTNETYSTSGQVAPDIEDINLDNTLNENNNYFQYKVSLRKEDLYVGNNYITDKIDTKVEFADEKEGEVTWYQFKIPIYDYDKRVGAIQDFKSIRFFRMFMTKFTDSTVLRFGKLALVRGEWRKYNSSFLQAGEYLVDELSQTPFDVGAVNIEENGRREPVNYILPPGISRDNDPSNPITTRLNEQSMSLKVIDLQDGDARAVYKNVGLDVRKYKKLKMFIHAESVPGHDELRDEDLHVFVRLGTDYKNNYYEYEIPLKVTLPGYYDGTKKDNDDNRFAVWPEENNLDLEFELLQKIKQDRNDRMRDGDANVSLTRLFTDFSEEKKVSIMGNPNLANVQTIMIGIRNPKKVSASSSDDGLAKSGEIWVNELRLSNFDEKGGWAANARITAKLADFGSITLAGSTSKPGFGAINQKVSQRQKEENNRFDISSNFELGKFFPEKWNVRIPLYIGYSENVKNPEYDPLNPDIPFKVTMNNKNIPKNVKDSIKLMSQDFSMRKSINLTNVKVEKNEGTPKVYDISNFSVSYGYNETNRRDINTISNTTKNYVGSLFYNFNATPKVVEPFRNVKFLEHKSFRIIKDFNFYYLPSQMSFRTSMNKTYGEILQRNIYDSSLPLPVSVQKNFVWIRQYDFNYNISKSLKLEFSATNNARIDEPQGRVLKDAKDYKLKRDTIMNSIRHFGRNTQYNQTFNLTYTLPINKIPIFNWVSSNFNYMGNYSWTVAPITLSDIKIGNTLQNGNSKALNTNFSMTTLYGKVRYLDNLNKKYRGRQQGNKKKEEETVTYEVSGIKFYAEKEKIITHRLKTSNVSLQVTGANGTQIVGETRVIDDNRVAYTIKEDQDNVTILVTGKRDKRESVFKQVVDHTLLTLMSVRSVAISLNDVSGTLLPGYLPKTHFMGMSSYVADSDMYGPKSSITTPTYPFIFGWQEDDFGEWAINNNVITKDTSNIQPFVQTHSRNWNIRATIEPVRDLKIDVNWTHSLSKNTNKFFRYAHDADAGVDRFMQMNPSQTGSFSMSIITLLTAFEPISSKGDYTSATFDKFSNNRYIIASRLAGKRKDYDGLVDDEGFPSGYGSSSQDVLIPAFMSAYMKISPDKIWLESFPSLLKSMPNWKITYNGLSKIPAFKKIFRSVNITHSYRSTYNVGSYMSRLANEYVEGADGLNLVRDELSNYYSRYQINGISIDERLSPLVSFDMKMNNSFDFKVEVKKERRLNMSFANLQLSEEKRNEYVLGAGYRIKDVEIAIKTKGQQRNFKSDLNLRLDFSVRNSKVIMHKLQEGFHQPTDGQLLYSIKTTADYVLSNRFNVTVFYDHTITKPTIQRNYPKRDIRFGLRLRFTLAS